MADPKTCGPDPYRLLETAIGALGSCEVFLPEAPPEENIDRARQAVARALPHVERRIGDELSARLSRFSGASS
jgi:hypothetical protein